MLEIKGKGDNNTQFSNNSVRYRKIPRINTDADNLMDLIELNDSVYETIFTTCFTTVVIVMRCFTTVPDWPPHS